jgi:tetratricopeptide (TPR) repeat protein
MTSANPALIEEFAAEAESEKNVTRGAIGGDRQINTDIKLGMLPKDERANMRKALGFVKRALKMSNSGDHQGGAKYALKALDLAPDAAMPNHVVGLLLFRLGRLSRALEFYERAWKADPKDAEIYLNIGIVAWKLDMLESAEKFYRLCIQIAPNNIDGLINLASVLRDQGRYEDAIELLRARIYLMPEQIELWNSLGTVLADSGDPLGAAPFYIEALRLKPDFARAHNNLGNVYELTGEPNKAIEHFDEALKKPQDATDRATMRHGRSLALLEAGRLEEGWKAQQVRLDPDNTQATLFSMKPPRWESLDLEDVRGKTVVMVGEQGLGDEILFLNSGHDFIDAIGPDGELRIACEKRLVPLIARSFPTAKVQNHMSTVLEGRNVRATPGFDDGADYWTPMGDPLGALRPRVESFPDTPAFLTPDPVRVAEFRAELDELGPELKVGMLWKSLKMTAQRQRYFSPLEAWRPVLETPGVRFINMQYGETDEDLAQARDLFGIDIYTPKNLNLRDDLDGVAAMGVALDQTIGPMNASLNLAGACGGEIWIISANRRHWTVFSADRLVWYPTSRFFWGEGFGDWTGVMAKIGDALKQRVKEFDA